jgi:hypothetical protein
METERRNYNAKNPQRRIEQSEYLLNEKNKYPLLSADVSKNQVIRRDSKTQSTWVIIPEPVKQPPVTIPDHYKVTTHEQINNRRSEQNIQQNTNVQNTNINKQQPVIKSPQSNTNDTKQRRDNGNTKPINSNPTNQTDNSIQRRNAEQYHQNTWKDVQPQKQPVQQPQQQIYTPPPVQQENRRVEEPVKQNIQTPSNNKRR